MQTVKSTREVVESFLSLTGQGAPVEQIGELFSSDVDFFIAGDVANVPWIGRKNGPTGAAEFYRQIREAIISETFDVSDMMVQDRRAIILGNLESRVRQTGKLITTEFAFDLVVEGGKISRFRLFEDSFAVAQAVA